MRGPRVLDPIRGRIFAVGDIHGCPGELEVLLQHLRGAQRLSGDDLLVFVGDYVDRGEGSREVIQQLVKLQELFPATVFLRGNHDDMFLSYLGLGGARGSAYLDNGGVQCLRSYGVAAPYHQQEARLRVPGDHLSFLSQLEYAVIAGDYLFCHAGINPLRDIYTQIPDDLLWIRDEFLERRHFLEKTVIFGHTPYQEAIFMLPHKIGIDTGLVYGNKLTCIELPSMALHQVNSGTKQVVRTVFDKGAQ